MPPSAPAPPWLRALAPAVTLGLLVVGLHLFPAPAGPGGSPTLTVEASEALVDEVMSLFAAGKHAEALAPLETLRRAYPRNDLYMWRAAEAHEALGHAGEAAELYDLYMEHSAMALEACPTVGHLYWNAGRPDEAVDSLRQCVAYETDNTDFVLALALMLERTGATDEAGQLFALGLQLAPEYLDFQLGTARLALRAGDPETSRRLAEEVAATRDNDVDALLVLAMALSDLHRPEEARRHAERVIHLEPAYEDAYLILGRIAEQQRQHAAAVEIYDALLARNPDRLDAQRARERALGAL